MNRPGAILAVLTLTFVVGWLAAVFFPSLQLGALQPVAGGNGTGLVPPALSGEAVVGQRVYEICGCFVCHSQQVRPAPLTSDIEKGLGGRASVPRDYLHDRPAFFGDQRVGPDLTNAGARNPEAAWHHRHLYEPRSLAGWSVMPSFRFLYRVRKIEGQTSDVALTGLTGPHAPPPGYEVVPTSEARALVAYLLSLRQSPGLPELAPTPGAQAGDAAPGRSVYTRNCAICHQENGLGIPGQFPPLAGSEWVSGDNERILAPILLYGLQGPIEVKGVRFNSAMPPWGHLGDEQIAAVLTYIRSSWGNSAPAVSAESVAEARRSIGPRKEPWTLKELRALPSPAASPP